MKKLLWSLIAISCLAVVCCRADARIVLGQGWVFKGHKDWTMQDSGWQKEGYDDHLWSPIEVGRGYREQAHGYTPYNYYRTAFNVPAEWNRSVLLLHLGPVDDVDYTHINGKLIGTTGMEGGAGLEWPPRQPRVYPIQPGILRSGCENTLAVGVVDWDNQHATKGGLWKGPVCLEKAHSTLSDVVDIAEMPWGVCLQLANGASVRVQVYAEDVVRIRMSPDGLYQKLLAHDLVMERKEPKSAYYRAERTSDSLHLRTQVLDVRIGLRPFRLAFYDSRGNLLTQQASGAWWGSGWLGDSFTCRSDEHFLGLGEPGRHIDRRGEQHRISVRHTCEAHDIQTPFWVSSKGYGLFFLNSFDGYVDVASTDSGLINCRFEGGEVDYFIINAPTPGHATSRYTWLTGRASLPPRWAFGYWQAPAAEGTEQWAYDTITRLRESGFPIDAVHMDGWHWGSDGLDFTPRRFANGNEGGGKMLKWLHERGVKCTVWHPPFVWPGYGLFDKAVRGGYLATGEDGKWHPVHSWVGNYIDIGCLDFLNPEAREWWESEHDTACKLGIDGIMCDGGDGEEIPWDILFDGKYRGKEVHNLFPQLFNSCSTNALQRHRPNERVIIWTRTGFAGSQRYPLTWGGDQESSHEGGKILLRAGVNAGICGFPYWAHDGGGFVPSRTREYYVRSCQWTFLSPVGLVLGSRDFYGPNPVGNEPWVYGSEVEAIVKKYVKLRYRLMPYIYSYAVSAWETGWPIMRAMPLEFPDDPKTYACDYQYMLGSDILVAPAYEDSKEQDLSITRPIYLPKGRWYDFHNDRVYDGPTEISYKAAFDVLPIFVRAGSVIPYGPDIDHIEGVAPAELTIDVYPGANGSFEILEDDGLTHAYKKGEVARTRIEHRESSKDGKLLTSIVISAPKGHYKGMHTVRTMSFRFHSATANASATVDGKPAGFEVKRDKDLLLVGPISVRGRTEVLIAEQDHD